MADKSDTKKSIMIEMLEKSLGVVSTACKAANISRDTHYRWLKEDELYAEAVESLNNVSLDFAESQLFNAMKEGNITAVIFYLKTKGKDRGILNAFSRKTYRKNQNN